MKSVKIILNSDVVNLGEEGDVCAVAAGYARNYLFPNKLAHPYNKNFIKLFESRKDKIAKAKEEKRIAALSLKEKLQQCELTIYMACGDSGRLFGSVGNSMVADELAKIGYSIERKKIEVPSHTIKMVGDYQAVIRLYGRESVDLTLHVRDQKEENMPKKSEKQAAEDKTSAESTEMAASTADTKAAAATDGTTVADKSESPQED